MNKNVGRGNYKPLYLNVGGQTEKNGLGEVKKE